MEWPSIRTVNRNKTVVKTNWNKIKYYYNIILCCTICIIEIWFSWRYITSESWSIADEYRLEGATRCSPARSRSRKNTSPQIHIKYRTPVVNRHQSHSHTDVGLQRLLYGRHTSDDLLRMNRSRYRQTVYVVARRRSRVADLVVDHAFTQWLSLIHIWRCRRRG